jgi:mRNA-degrading endonuclease RelE of RelBE toxin-antitoxin system
VSRTVVLTASAQRDLRRLDRPVATRILDALTRLADTGQGDVTRLQGTPDEWRLRTGDWRIRFRYAPPPRRWRCCVSCRVGRRTAKESVVGSTTA